MTFKLVHIPLKMVRLRLIALSSGMLVLSLIMSYLKEQLWPWLLPLIVILLLFAIFSPMRLAFLIQGMELLQLQIRKGLFWVLFYIVLTPMSLLFRLLRPATIVLKIDKTVTSYWSKPEQVSFDNDEQFKKQF
ncbi:hypothetical protein [Celerinatantimonas sp. YJH-8]|uniref:hypothetical protein n=1 Tax=Celerinatantimonas sp. YJH-8 TaxID=3228714 RepID=UPI0038C9F6DB